MQPLIVKRKRTLPSYVKFNDFVNSKATDYNKKGSIISRDSAVTQFSSLTKEEKNDLSLLDLNIYYYLINDSHTKYISKRELLVFLIDSYISMLSIGKALKI